MDTRASTMKCSRATSEDDGLTQTAIRLRRTIHWNPLLPRAVESNRWHTAQLNTSLMV
jgi:hypothetical protein